MHLTSIHISPAQTIIPFSRNPLLINVYGLIHSYADIWLELRNYVKFLPIFMIRLPIGTDSALSGKVEKHHPWVDRGLFVIKLELKPAHVTITLRRPRSAKLRM